MNIDEWMYCGAEGCQQEHVLINGLNHHQNKLEYRNDANWGRKLDKRQREELAEWLKYLNLSINDVMSFQFVNYTEGGTYVIIYRKYVRTGDGAILVTDDFPVSDIGYAVGDEELHRVPSFITP